MPLQKRKNLNFSWKNSKKSEYKFHNWVPFIPFFFYFIALTIKSCKNLHATNQNALRKAIIVHIRISNWPINHEKSNRIIIKLFRSFKKICLNKRKRSNTLIPIQANKKKDEKMKIFPLLVHFNESSIEINRAELIFKI